MPRYKAIIEYDGSLYNGMQRQNNLKTIQGELETALSKFYNTKMEIDYSGRTDSGVHAIGQVIHFDAPVERDFVTIKNGVHFYLNNCSYENRIAILNIEKTNDNFHSRFDAKKRFYIYKIINRPENLTFQSTTHWYVKKKINIELMREASTILLGCHDFSSFRAKDCQGRTAIRTIDSIDIYEVAGFFQTEIHLIFEARSFLHHMIRNIVGSLVMIGYEKKDKIWLQNVLQAKDRTKAGIMAPASGLYFLKVEY